MWNWKRSLLFMLVAVSGCARAGSDVRIAVDVSPLVHAKEVPGDLSNGLSVTQIPLDIRNIAGSDWRDVSLKVESIDDKGSRELIKEQFIGLWESEENVPVTALRDSEKVVITIAMHGRDHVFALYQIPEEESVIPERQ